VQKVVDADAQRKNYSSEGGRSKTKLSTEGPVLAVQKEGDARDGKEKGATTPSREMLAPVCVGNEVLGESPTTGK